MDQTIIDITKITLLGFALSAVMTTAFYLALLKPMGVTCTVGFSLDCTIDIDDPVIIVNSWK
jgi:hypothetical protein